VAEGSPLELIERHSTPEVVELRFPVGTEVVEDRFSELAERIEVLPDRVLLYTRSADATVRHADLRALDPEPETILVRRSSMEDVFLHLTGRTLVD
jgi:lipooligosaccharide transport system ATP-binding protein